jgi:hypothetical protein
MSTGNEYTTKHRRGLGRRLFWGAVLLGGALILTQVLTGYGHPLFGRSRAERSAAVSWEHMNQGLSWVLQKVNATGEQQSKIHAMLNELNSSRRIGESNTPSAYPAPLR